MTEEISEELTEEISEDTDEEDISEDILEENQVEVENEGQENVETLLEESHIENAESEKEHVQEFAKTQYNTEVFKDSSTDQELIFVEHTEEIKAGLPEKSEDKQIPLSSRSQRSLTPVIASLGRTLTLWPVWVTTLSGGFIHHMLCSIHHIT